MNLLNWKTYIEITSKTLNDNAKKNDTAYIQFYRLKRAGCQI